MTAVALAPAKLRSIPAAGPSLSLLPCPATCLQSGVREYALSRALQLDPKCVPAWVALARLYAGARGI